MKLLALLGILALVLSAQKSVSDDEIFDNVRRRLAGDPDVKGARLDVTVNQGVVTIRGKVDKEKSKQKAERLASREKGVKKVINELRVDPTP